MQGRERTWRGWRRWLADGATVARLVDGGFGRRCCCFSGEKFFFLPSPSFFFVLSGCLFGFGFVSVSFFLVCFCSSLSLRVALSLFLSSGLSVFLHTLSSVFSPLFIGAAQVGGMVSAPSITHGWSALSVVVGARRETRENFRNFCLLFC